MKKPTDSMTGGGVVDRVYVLKYVADMCILFKGSQLTRELTYDWDGVVDREFMY